MPGGFPGGFGGFPGGGGGGGVRFTSMPMGGAGGFPGMGGMGGGGGGGPGVQDPFSFFSSFFGSDNPFAGMAGAGRHGGGGGPGMDEDNGDGGMGGMFGGGGMPPGMGRGGGTTRRGPQKPEAVKRQLPCSLEDLYSGATKKLKVTRQRMDAATGGRRQEERILEVPIRPGFRKGTSITFEHEGDEEPGQVPADIVFTIGETPAPVPPVEPTRASVTSPVSVSHFTLLTPNRPHTLPALTLRLQPRSPTSGSSATRTT